MQMLFNTDRSFWHTVGMAKSLGVSLTDAMADGRLDHGGYSELVSACKACPHPKHCMDFMAEPAAPAAGAPTFCANKQTLDLIAEMG